MELCVTSSYWRTKGLKCPAFVWFQFTRSLSHPTLNTIEGETMWPNTISEMEEPVEHMCALVLIVSSCFSIRYDWAVRSTASQQERPQLVCTQRALCLPHALLRVPAGVSECGGAWSFCQTDRVHRTLLPAGRPVSRSGHLARRVHTGEGRTTEVGPLEMQNKTAIITLTEQWGDTIK